MITAFLAVTVTFGTRSSRLMSGGVIPAGTGRNVVSVGCMHPLIIRGGHSVQRQLFTVGAAEPDL